MTESAENLDSSMNTNHARRTIRGIAITIPEVRVGDLVLRDPPQHGFVLDKPKSPGELIGRMSLTDGVPIVTEDPGERYE